MAGWAASLSLHPQQPILPQRLLRIRPQPESSVGPRLHAKPWPLRQIRHPHQDHYVFNLAYQRQATWCLCFCILTQVFIVQGYCVAYKVDAAPK